MKVYEGITEPSEQFTVMVDGKPLSPVPSQKLFNHSPDGYAWGYSGSGPAQLSLALLLDALGDKKRAVHLHQDFKFRVVAAWSPDKSWTITDDEIKSICDELEKERATD